MKHFSHLKLYSMIVILVILMSGNGYLTMAEEDRTFGFNAQFRWRGEADGRDFADSTDIGTFSVLRSRFSISAQQNDISAFLQFQYPYRMSWNSSAPLGPSIPLDMHQGFLKIDNLYLDDLSLKIGRTELKYGDERLIGPVGWSNVGRVFDGFVIQYDIDLLTIDGFYTKQVERYSASTPGNQPDDNFFGLWGVYKPLKLNLFVLNDDLADTNTTGAVQDSISRTTLGMHYMEDYDLGLSVLLDLAYQIGMVRTFGTANVENNINAWMFLIGLWYHLPGDLNLSVGGGIDMVSGDKGSTNDIETFNNLYYTGHKWRGYMDLFLGSNAAGLKDIFIDVKVKPTDRMSMKLTFHNFAAAQDFFVPAQGTTQAAFGNEIDLGASYKIKENLKYSWGAGYFIASEHWKGSSRDAGFWGFMILQTEFDLAK